MEQKHLHELFAYNFRQFRKRNKMTQKQLGLALGYSEKAVAKWESAKALPSVEALVRIAELFETDFGSLFSDPGKTYLLGIDGGGTKTHYMLCDMEGKVLKEMIGHGSNPFDMGLEASIETLSKDIHSFLGNILPSSVSVFAGIAGGGVESVRQAYNEFFSKFGFMSFDSGSDSENVIAAGLGDKDGIILILGTGVCLFEARGNERIRKAGWGYLLDEAGSAYNIGQDALKAYFSCIDGLCEKSALYEKIREIAPQNNNDFLVQIYAEGKRYIATFASLVFQCAEEYGDRIAQRIIEQNVSFAGKLIERAAFDFTDSTTAIDCVLAGGVSKHKDIVNYIKKAMNHPEKIRLQVLEGPPVIGAIRKAKEIFQLQKGEK